MSDFVGLVTLLSPFFALVGLGILTARIGRWPETAFVGMQVFLIYLALPCLFFRLIAEKPIGELANWRFIGLTTLATIMAFGLSFLLSLRSLSPPERVMAAVSGSYSNIGYMGPPLIASLLGVAGSAPVALIFVFDTIFLFSAVPLLMGAAGAGTTSFAATTVEVARRVLTHPFVLATMVGLSASVLQWRPPAAVDTMVGWLSGASAPVALFLLGVTVAMRPVARVPREVWALVAIKLVLHPMIVWSLLMLVGGIEPVWIKTAVVMAALPPALNIFVLARQYDVGIERASACVLVGTLVSMATLTAFIWLLETGSLPSGP
jgi:hypothetical protein